MVLNLDLQAQVIECSKLSGSRLILFANKYQTTNYQSFQVQVYFFLGYEPYLILLCKYYRQQNIKHFTSFLMSLYFRKT